MAKGERKFDISSINVTRKSFEPPAPGNYEARLVSTTAEIRMSEESKLPRINCYFELLGTETGDKGSLKRVYHDFHTSMKPSEKDGVAMIARQNGLVAFGKAIGHNTLPVGVVKKTVPFRKNGKTVDGKTEEVQLLDPSDVLKYVKGLDGETVKLRVKLEKRTDFATGKKTGEVDAKVDYFEEADEDAESPFADTDEDETDEVEETEEEVEEDDDEVEEDEDEEVEEDEEPAPKKKAAAPAKKKSKK